MHGPYTAHLTIARQELVLTEDELVEGSKVACRFYQDATPALAEGALRSAVFTAALLLEPGQDARVEVRGFTGTGVKKRPTVYAADHARREDNGAFVSTVGSRFGERTFRGV